MKKLLVLFLIFLFFLSSCEQNPYQLVKGENGTVYRLNKKTGQISIIKDDKVIDLETPEAIAVKKIREKTLEELKEWGERQIPGKKLYVKLETSWRENKLLYKFTAYPYESLKAILSSKNLDYYTALQRSQQKFIIELLDKNGFVIKEIDIKLWEMTRIVDEEGNPIEMVMNSQIDCSKEIYESINDYSIKWSLEIKLIPTQYEDYRKELISKIESFMNKGIVKGGKDKIGSYIVSGEGQRVYLDIVDIYTLIHLVSAFEKEEQSKIKINLNEKIGIEGVIDSIGGKKVKEVEAILGNPIAVLKGKYGTQRQYDVKGKIITVFFDDKDICSGWSE
jgi:hypothetical protein